MRCSARARRKRADRSVALFLALGTMFGALAAAAAYLISYHEYRQQMLRPDQNAAKMAIEVAVITLLFFVVASVVLGYALTTGAAR